MARRKKTYEDDDGRTIANMNVDGMPWYQTPTPSKAASTDPVDSEKGEPLELTKEESRALYWGVIKAALLIGGIFIVGALIFILFCIYVWLR